MSIPILSTKLHIPQPRANAITRQRLIERLDAGLNGKLTLISAPAGFGKTTIAAEWLAQCQRPVGWLSLDSNDSEPVRFLSYFVAALQSRYETAGQIVLDALQSSQRPTIHDLMVALINEISGLSEPFLLVLDDYHVIESEEIDNALSFFLEHMPPQMYLVITTREDPQLPLSKLRVRAQLTEIRANDLRFTPDEALHFFNQNMGFHLSEEDVAKLEQRTEGWIAGLQLAALSMQAQTDPAQFIDTFTGSHRFVVDYLVEEVLNAQPDDIRQFLLQTAILESLNADLCAAITGQANCQIMLERLERDNLFIVPLDDTRQWYRYHHLFGDALQLHLQNQNPDDVANLHRRASEWYIANEKPYEAIHHAIAAKDFAFASELLEAIWNEIDATYQSATWFRWVAALPQDIVRQRPLLSHGYARSVMMTGNLEASAEWLQLAEQALAQPAEQRIGDVQLLRTLPASISCGRMYLALSVGDIDATLHHAERALEQLVDGDDLNRIQAVVMASLAHWANGDLEIAESQLNHFIDDMQAAGYMGEEIELVAVLADMRITLGRLYDAYRAYEHALQLAEQLNSPALNGVEDLHRGIADLFTEWNKLADAQSHLELAQQLGAQGIEMPDWKHRMNASWARFKIAIGDYDSALVHLDEAERHYIRSPLPLVRPISALKARIWIKQGQLQKAQEWVRQQGLSLEIEPIPYLNEFEYITLARLLLAQYRVKGVPTIIRSADKLLARLRKTATDRQRNGSLIEILVLQAQCFTEMNDTSRALDHVAQALTIAEPEDYARIFLDEGEPVRKLLVQASENDMMPDYVHRLLTAFQNVSPVDPAMTQLSDPLSERELDVLRLLPTDLTGPEIAEKLMVSLSTLRTHTRNIYSKLDVNSRRSAVSKAQDLGLL